MQNIVGLQDRLVKAAAAVGVCPKDICATNEFLQQLRKHRRRLVD